MLIKHLDSMEKSDVVGEKMHQHTVEPRFNEPLYNEVLGITNDIFQPCNSVLHGKEPRRNSHIP